MTRKSLRDVLSEHSEVHNMVHWSRRTLEDKYGGWVLHEDWVLGENIQFGWREKCYWNSTTEKHEDPVFEIAVRRRQGIFRRGRSDWYLMFRFDTFKDACNKLNEIIRDTDEDFWIKNLEEADIRLEKKAQEELEKKFCGFGSGKAIGWGY